MAYLLEGTPKFDKQWPKLRPWQQNAIRSKLLLILTNPYHFKNLRAPKQYLKRVHINSHFVLTFSINELTKTVTLEDFDHHDKIYKK